ncbi:MAG: ABC transporter permease [Acidobacteriia bacterium]|nr:ABC transporter permease [Terriglobia bacterium]
MSRSTRVPAAAPERPADQSRLRPVPGEVNMPIFSNARAAVANLRGKLQQKAGLWVPLREAFWMALQELRNHKLRSFLTLLGIVIATTTLIVVMSVVNGMNVYIATKIANLGTNTFVLHQFKWAQGYDEFLKALRRNKPIRLEDYEFIQDRLVGYEALSAIAQLQPGPEARHGGHSVDEVNLIGVTASHAYIGREKVQSGRYLSDQDYRHNARVCFIGQDIVDKLFPSVDPIGKELAVGGQTFSIVGVAERVGSAFGVSQDNFVFVPLGTFRNLFMPHLELLVFIKAPDSQHLMELEDEVRVLMRARRHVPYHEDDTFGINASETLMSAWQNLTGSIFAVTIGVVAVFMVVGGIVIMNIMLATVTERTHEIGIRKSVGARRSDILWQFLIEAAALAALGGLMGVLLSYGIAWLVAVVFTAEVSLSAVIVGVTLSTLVGLFFGIYPARRAAALDPIQALRAEK